MELVFLAILIGMMMLMLGIGFPVAFALPGAAMLTIGMAAGTGALFAGSASAFFAHGTAVEWLTAGVTNFRGVYWEADRDTLIAIPLFVFMGIMLQRSRIAEDLLVTMAKLFGSLPGGLGISVIVVGALLAATTGIVGATVVAMGLISLPAMMRNGYAQPLATGSIMASGTLGQIIPPSIVLIILADQLTSAVDAAGQLRADLYIRATGESTMPSEFSVLSASAGDLFMGALLPGLMLVGLYILYILGYALIRPSKAPAVRTEGAMDARFWLEVFFTVVPPLLLILIVLGSIIMGVATVTQAGAIGAAGAMVMAGYKLGTGALRFAPAILSLACIVILGVLSSVYDLNVRQLDRSGDHVGVAMAAVVSLVLLGALAWSTARTFRIENTLHDVMVETAKTSALVFIILLGAAMLISAFRGFGGEELVKNFLTGLPGGFWTQFLVVMAVIFVLGFFLDYIEIAIVVVPIVAPILLMNPEANVTAVWLGVMIGLNIQTSFLTPPFGFALFYLRGVADRSVTTLNMYRGVIPFIALQVGAMVITAWNPWLVNWLPARVSLTSENAPPPRNPRLQHCVDEHLLATLPAQEARVSQLVADLRAAAGGDALPTDRAGDLDRALDGMTDSFARLEAFRAARLAIAEATPAYRPLHVDVSAMRREIDRLTARVGRLEIDLRGLRGDEAETLAERAEVEARIAETRDRIAAIEASIPAEWDPAHKAFLDLVRAEGSARRDFINAAGRSYVTVRDLGAEIAAADTYAALLPEVEALAAEVGVTDAEALAEKVSALEDRIADLAGSDALSEALADLRRTLSGRRASPEDAAAAAPVLVEVAQAEAAWRSAAASGPLLPALVALETETHDTLGLREQDRLPRQTGLTVARCLSEHRDISLSF
ncbi:MAG: TRAP transporter large permease subunit [Rhodobacteraceae bacterium]|jgi:tripartite ATP-independent transporter DctM subunit|nr:TRAP transporter large permease subunit [Paracoccaceae bacterium]